MTSQKISADYIAAFRAANGYAPIVKPNGNRFDVTTRTGSCADYTARDLMNLTRGLKRLAEAAE